MNLAKKLTKIFSLFFLAALLASCDSGCVAADEFDGSTVTVKSNPGVEGIVGTYNNVSSDSGGQRIPWTATGLRSNGEQFLIRINGGWLPWNGGSTGGGAFDRLPRCDFCARKDGINNCICYDGQVSEPEEGADGNQLASADCAGDDKNDPLKCDNNGVPVGNFVDCKGLDQQDPLKCTCTILGEGNVPSALVTDPTVYHLPLNWGNKSGVKHTTPQEICKYTGGMGLYIGLFGRDGNVTPNRDYHLFTQELACDIEPNANGECIDDYGKDVTQYLFRSDHDTIFIKDDKNGNNSDNDYAGSGADFHASNEFVKLTILDSFYLDNKGSYSVTFFKGVGSKDDSGLLEFLVGLIEDTVMGELDSDNVRQGGVIEFMYKSIVTDSGFVQIVQVLLSLYIAFYGLATLLGVAEINKKELMSRVLKVSLILFFTSENSWFFYNEIVVGFFKGSMDYVVGIFTNLSDGNITTTSLLATSQLGDDDINFIDRANNIGNASRFSYIDLTIEKLLSAAAAKKIFGLFLSVPASLFGIIYIFVIYFLIAFFVYVMLLAATFYVVNMMKLVLVLSLGPVFMCFSLFSQTSSIFKKWLSFLGSRSLEIIILFIILYNFVVLIDQKFVTLLYYRACVQNWGISYLQIPVIKSYIDRSLASWTVDFIALGGLIFITKLIVEQIPYVTGYLITIGGEANKDAGGGGRGQSGMNMASGIIDGTKNASGKKEGGLAQLAKFGASRGGSAAYYGAGAAMQGGTKAARVAKAGFAKSATGKAMASSGVGQVAKAVMKKMPYGPRDTYRNHLIDTQINKFKAEAVKQGLSGKDADMYVRKETMKAMQNRMHRQDNKKYDKNKSRATQMKLVDVNMTSVMKRLDNQLVKKPLKEFIKKASKEMKESKTDALFGQEARDKLQFKAEQWAEKNIVGGKKSADKFLNKSGMKSFIKEQSMYTTSEAGKAAAGNEGFKSKYLQHLKSNELSQVEKSKGYDEKYAKKDGLRKMYKGAKAVASVISRTESNNAEKTKDIFLRKAQKHETMNKFKEESLKKSAGYGGLAHYFPQNSSLNIFRKSTRENMRDKLTGDAVFGRALDEKAVKQAGRDGDATALRGLLNDKMNDFEKKKDNIKKEAEEKSEQPNKKLSTYGKLKLKGEEDSKKEHERISDKEKKLKKENDEKNEKYDDAIKNSNKSDKDKEKLKKERDKVSKVHQEAMTKLAREKRNVTLKWEREEKELNALIAEATEKKDIIEKEKVSKIEKVEKEAKLFLDKARKPLKDQLEASIKRDIDAKFNGMNRADACRLQQELVLETKRDHARAEEKQKEVKESINGLAQQEELLVKALDHAGDKQKDLEKSIKAIQESKDKLIKDAGGKESEEVKESIKALEKQEAPLLKAERDHKEKQKALEESIKAIQESKGKLIKAAGGQENLDDDLSNFDIASGKNTRDADARQMRGVSLYEEKIKLEYLNKLFDEGPVIVAREQREACEEALSKQRKEVEDKKEKLAAEVSKASADIRNNKAETDYYSLSARSMSDKEVKIRQDLEEKLKETKENLSEYKETSSHVIAACEDSLSRAKENEKLATRVKVEYDDPESLKDKYETFFEDEENEREKVVEAKNNLLQIKAENQLHQKNMINLKKENALDGKKSDSKEKEIAKLEAKLLRLKLKETRQEDIIKSAENVHKAQIELTAVRADLIDSTASKEESLEKEELAAEENVSKMKDELNASKEALDLYDAEVEILESEIAEKEAQEIERAAAEAKIEEDRKRGEKEKADEDAKKKEDEENQRKAASAIQARARGNISRSKTAPKVKTDQEVVVEHETKIKESEERIERLDLEMYGDQVTALREREIERERIAAAEDIVNSRRDILKVSNRRANESKTDLHNADSKRNLLLKNIVINDDKYIGMSAEFNDLKKSKAEVLSMMMQREIALPKMTADVRDHTFFFSTVSEEVKRKFSGISNEDLIHKNSVLDKQIKDHSEKMVEHVRASVDGKEQPEKSKAYADYEAAEKERSIKSQAYEVSDLEAKAASMEVNISAVQRNLMSCSKHEKDSLQSFEDASKKELSQIAEEIEVAKKVLEDLQQKESDVEDKASRDKAEKESKDKAEKEKAAAKIQALFRGKQAKKKVVPEELEDEAVIDSEEVEIESDEEEERAELDHPLMKDKKMSDKKKKDDKPEFDDDKDDKKPKDKESNSKESKSKSSASKSGYVANKDSKKSAAKADELNLVNKKSELDKLIRKDPSTLSEEEKNKLQSLKGDVADLTAKSALSNQAASRAEEKLSDFSGEEV